MQFAFNLRPLTDMLQGSLGTDSCTAAKQNRELGIGKADLHILCELAEDHHNVMASHILLINSLLVNTAADHLIAKKHCCQLSPC